MNFNCRILAIIAILAGTSAAFAESGVYRSVRPSGEVVYSNAPAVDARATKSVSVFNTSGLTTGVTRAAIDAMNERQVARMKTLDEAQAKELKKREAVKAAAQAKADGAEPLPGERIALAGGGSRLSDAYWARQQRLEDKLADAEKAYADASTVARNAM